MGAGSQPKNKQANHVKRNIDANDSSNDNYLKEDDRDREYTMYHVSSGSTKPLIVDGRINEINSPMELDIGASVSLMSKTNFQPLREKGAVVNKTKARLSTYMGEAIAVAGTAEVQVEHNGHSVVLPLIITREEGPTLLGRNWLSVLKLEWQKISAVRSQPERTLYNLLDQYADVFQDKLGCLKGVKPQIPADADATPVFHRARSVPFALRTKIEKELDCILAECIIQPVKFYDWAAPIVPVLKGDGSVRICGDYKVTINKVAKIDKYPIPQIVCICLAAKNFTKLDLSHAYQQVEL